MYYILQGVSNVVSCKPFQGQQDIICISQALFALFAFCSLFYATQKNKETLTHILCKSNINATPSEQVFYMWVSSNVPSFKCTILNRGQTISQISDHLQVLTVYFKSTLLSVLWSLISGYLSRFSLLNAHTKGSVYVLARPLGFMDSCMHFY